jgi:lambda family phage portal protein
MKTRTRPPRVLQEASRATGRSLSRAERLGERVDQALQVFAPQWAAKRQLARVRHHLFHYAYPSGRGSRLHGDWSPQRYSGDAAVDDLVELRAKSRDLVRQEPHAASLLRTLDENVVGTGIRPQSRATADETGLTSAQVSAWNRACDRVFSAWAGSDLCDSTGHGTFYDLQSLLYRSYKRDGEAFVHLVSLPETTAPRLLSTAVEVIPPERVSTPDGYAAQQLPDNLTERLRQGVEVGKRDQALAYWIASGNPDDPLRYPNIEWQRVRRFRNGQRNVLHLFRRDQADQHRGVPILCPVLSTFRMLSKYMEAELTAARVSACISMFVKQAGMLDASGIGPGMTQQSDGTVLESLEPGSIQYLDPGEEIQTFKADRPGTTFDPFVERILRAIASAVGLPYELLVRDFSKTNYSSMRAALLETRRGFRVDQAMLARIVLQPIWERVLTEAYARGMLPQVPQFLERRDALLRARWVPPAWGWVDPVKEIQASRDAVEGGLSTLADEASANGQDWQDVARARARELVLLRELEAENDLPPGSLTGLEAAEAPGGSTSEESAREDQIESEPGGASADTDDDEQEPETDGDTEDQ